MIDPNSSVFVEDWTDEKRKKFYQFCATEHYEANKLAKEFTFKANVDYGKWLLASGLLVHGGGLYAINAIKDVTKPDFMAALLVAAQWNVAGIFFILFAGLCAWLNFQYAALIYDDWADPAMVYRTDKYPKDISKTDPVGATRLLSMCSGMFALWAFVASAANVSQAMQTIM